MSGLTADMDPEWGPDTHSDGHAHARTQPTCTRGVTVTVYTNCPGLLAHGIHKLTGSN